MILIFCLIWTLDAYAGDIAEGGGQPTGVFESRASVSDEQKCVADICAGYSAAKKGEDSFSEDERKVIEPYMKEMKELVISTAEALADEKRVLLERAIDVLKDPKRRDSTIVHEAIGAAAFSNLSMMGFQLELYKDSYDSRTGQIIIGFNNKKWTEYLTRPWLKTDLPISQDIGRIMQRSENKAEALSLLSAPFVFKYLYPNLSYSEAVREEIKKIRSIQDRYKSQNQMAQNILRFDFDLSDNPVVRHVEQRLLIDEEIGNRILELSRRAREVDLYNTETKIRSHKSHGPGFIEQMAKLQSDVKDMKSTAEHVTGPFDWSVLDVSRGEKSRWQEFEQKYGRDKIRHVYEPAEYCLRTMEEDLMTLPTQKELDKNKQAVQDSSPAVKQWVARKLSKQTAGFISGQLGQIEFSFPLSKEGYAQNVKHIFSSMKNQARKNVENAGGPKGDGYAVGFATDPLRWGGSPVMVEYLNVCRDLGIKPVRDHTMTGLGVIAVGADSVKNPRLGASISMHELGHQVSDLLQTKSASDHSRQKYSEVKACLEGQHPPESVVKSANLAYGIGQNAKMSGAFYFEEDFADLIYATAGDKRLPNDWCHLVAIEKSTPLSLVSRAGDTHSSDLFRLINVEQYRKDSLPISCQNLASRGRVKFSKCL